MHKTIKKVSADFENLKFNTAIAALMSLINDFTKKGSVTKDELKTFLILLNPVAPHITEEIWDTLNYGGYVYQQSWPEYDEAKTVESTIEIAVQVNGKLRSTISVPADGAKEDIIAQAKEELGDRIAGKEIVKEIYVPGKIVNIVVKG